MGVQQHQDWKATQAIWRHATHTIGTQDCHSHAAGWPTWMLATCKEHVKRSMSPSDHDSVNRMIVGVHAGQGLEWDHEEGPRRSELQK